MTRRSITLLLPLAATLGLACSDGGLGPDQSRPTRVLTRIEILPSSALITTGETRQLTITAWDQSNLPMTEQSDWASKITYASSAPDVADVSSTGRLTGVTPGIAKITASLTVDGATATGTMTTKVDLSTNTDFLVTADRNGGWSPATVSVRAGSTVTWVIPDGVQLGTIWFNVWDSNAEPLVFTNGIATRTLSTPGTYYYGTGGGLMWYEQGGRIQVF
jgi:plastocyanin